MKTQVFIFQDKCHASLYGIDTYLRELTKSLSKDIGINIIVPNVDYFKVNYKKRVVKWYLPCAGMNPEKTADYIAKIIELNFPEDSKKIFHFNYLHNAQLVKALKQKTNCKIVAVVHYMNWINAFVCGNPLLHDEHNISENEKQTLELSDAIISPSNCVRDILMSNYGIEKDKITVIYNGLTDCFEQNHRKATFACSAPTLIFAGRLTQSKGIYQLMEAFKTVVNHKPDAVLIIAGDDPVNKVKSIDIESSVQDNIVFTGRLTKNNLYSLYRQSDIGIVPSYFETFGYCAAEMMMHELPVIAARTSALTELVINNETGLTVPFTDNGISIELLAKNIIYLSDNPEKAKELGKNGRKRYVELFEALKFKGKMLDFYSLLVNN